jgi:ketosteroid isomerase-like protein
MVNAERAFAAASLREGMQAAFLTYLADDALLFRKGAFVNGKAYFKQVKPAAGVLSWRPMFADIAASGDVGVTMGPSLFCPPDAAAPAGFGTFLSVWRLTAAGEWKVWLDFGSSHAQASWPGQEIMPPTKFATITQAAADTASMCRLLATTEEKFAQVAQHRGLQAAYHTVPLHSDLHLLRNGQPPCFGSALHQGLSPSTAHVHFTLLKTYVATSGDWGTTFGIMAYNNRRGPYQRIWRRTSPAAPWQLQIEYLNINPVQAALTAE